jgi:hypothetical protein
MRHITATNKSTTDFTDFTDKVSQHDLVKIFNISAIRLIRGNILFFISVSHA